jgi:hypothetical protein
MLSRSYLIIFLTLAVVVLDGYAQAQKLTPCPNFCGPGKGQDYLFLIVPNTSDQLDLYKDFSVDETMRAGERSIILFPYTSQTDVRGIINLINQFPATGGAAIIDNTGEIASGPSMENLANSDRNYPVFIGIKDTRTSAEFVHKSHVILHEPASKSFGELLRSKIDSWWGRKKQKEQKE